MTGIIDVGGGLRGIFGAGVFDRLLDEKITFDYCIGVSAGAANICSFLAGQRGRNLMFYTDYSLRPEYMGVRNIIRSGSYLNLDYVYGDLTNSGGENPLDFDTFEKSVSVFKTVCTNAVTAEPVYFDKKDYIRDDYSILKATCCLPVVCRPVRVGELLCFDGGVSDPVPVLRAFDDGCDKAVVVLTKPIAEKLERGGLDLKASRATRLKYPALSAALEARYILYNESIEKVSELESQGKVLVISPDSIEGLKILTKDISKLETLYNEGYEKALAIKAFM